MCEIVCKVCGSKWVVNKTHKLCDKCNQLRLHGKSRTERAINKAKSNTEPYKHTKTQSEASKRAKKGIKRGISDKAKKTIEQDELIYEEVFNTTENKCENCDCKLPDEFRDEDGRVIARFQYSHIVGKARASHLRHVRLNFNRLCLECHTIWDFGTQAEREQMKIWKNNLKNFENYLLKSY